MCTNICIFIKIYYIYPILYFLGKLFLEKTPLILGSFLYFCISKFVKGRGGINNPIFFPGPALTITFPFLFCKAEDEGHESAYTIPFPFLFCEAEDKGRPEPALTIPFPDNKFPNILALNIPNKILKNPPFCYFVSFFVLVILLVKY